MSGGDHMRPPDFTYTRFTSTMTKLQNIADTIQDNIKTEADCPSKNQELYMKVRPSTRLVFVGGRCESIFPKAGRRQTSL